MDTVIANCWAALTDSAPTAIDHQAWQVARDHGVCPLMPEPDHEIWSALLHAIAQRQLMHCSELKRISQALDGVTDYIALKGPALAVQLYGNPARRDSRDLDILVRPADVLRAASALHAIGYECQIPQGNALRHYVRNQHELALVHRHSAALLELQWAWAQRHYSVDADIERCLARADRLSVTGVTVKVFSPEDTVLYLALHGAKHGWSQLSFCTDFTAAAVRLSVDWNAVAHMARVAGLGRLLGVAAAISHRIFDLSTPVQTDARARLLAQRITDRWRRGRTSNSLLREFAGQRERWSDRARILILSLVTPTPSDTRWLVLPDPCFPIYYLLRPVRLSWRIVHRWSGRKLSANQIDAGQAHNETRIHQHLARRV
jgi:hypothetical protein